MTITTPSKKYMVSVVRNGGSLLIDEYGIYDLQTDVEHHPDGPSFIGEFGYREYRINGVFIYVEDDL